MRTKNYIKLKITDENKNYTKLKITDNKKLYKTWDNKWKQIIIQN